MENAPAPASPEVTTRAFAREARDRYEDAVTSDGVSAASWRAIAADLDLAADGLARVGTFASTLTSLRDRATDARQRADFATRMLEVARSHRVIDMSSLGSAS